MAATEAPLKRSNIINSFQSPCHRVNGCNVFREEDDQPGCIGFQSPCHRVNGCNKANRTCCRNRRPFQSPCRRGNGCISRRIGVRFPFQTTFSPLVVGAMAASQLRTPKGLRRLHFQSPCRRGNGCICSWTQLYIPWPWSLSVPLSSGQWLHLHAISSPGRLSSLSVPLSSGQWLHPDSLADLEERIQAFSPLVVGAMAASG